MCEENKEKISRHNRSLRAIHNYLYEHTGVRDIKRLFRSVQMRI